MTNAHDFRSRDDVIKHLTKSKSAADFPGYHGWEDPGQPYTQSQMVDMYGRPWVPTTEYLAIHRELHALEPRVIVSQEQGTGWRQW